MLARLALRNVRRAGRDYAIYFITVALGIAMFYAFNAVRGQAALLDALSADAARMVELLDMFVKLFSVVVACVLGFLVVYANRFLIRRRRREFGTYLLLGMSAGRVSRVLLIETALVGLASLAAGLVLGIAISQGLSFATAALMGTTMTRYRFVVSTDAIAFTTVCLLAIFAVSSLVDVIYIRRCRLVDLCSPHQASERAGIRHVGVRAAAFVASLALLACAYWQLKVNGLQEADPHFWAATALMLAGTFLFFWSAAGFAVLVLSRSRSTYLRGIRAFTVRQLSSKINTAFASMGVVCVMLFFALTTASVGMGLLELFSGNIREATRYDATLTASCSFAEGDPAQGELEAARGDIAAYLSGRAAGFHDLVRASAQVDYLACDLTYQTLTDQVRDASRLMDASTLDRVKRSQVWFVSQSQYNASVALIGEKSLDLAPDEFAVDNTFASTDALADALADPAVRISVAGRDLHAARGARHVSLDTSAIPDTPLVVVIGDDVAAGLRLRGDAVASSHLNLAYASDREAGDRRLAQLLSQALPLADGATPASDAIEDQFEPAPWPVTSAATANQMRDQATGLRMVIVYVALYIGFIMLVATAAVLAIQQLSETSDSLERYRRLFDLGCEPRTIARSLRTQTVIYFCAPLVLAACHTACAVLVLSGSLFEPLGTNPSGLIAIAAGSIAGVYALYLVATYQLSRGIVLASLRPRRSE